MASPAMRLRVLPRFPTRVEAVEPVVIDKTAGTYTFSWDYRGIASEPAPDQALYVLLQDGSTGTFYRTSLSNLPTGATDWADIQNRPAQINGLASLATTTGALEQTGANTFAIRAIGDATGPSLVTFTQATGLFQAQNAALSMIATNGGVATGSLLNDAVTFAKMQNIATNRLLGRSTAGSGDTEEITVGTGLALAGSTLTATAVAASGSVINSVSSVYTTNATLTAAIPFDNTTPQNTEGTEIQTVSIAASSSSNKLRIWWDGQGACTTATSVFIAALFIDSGVNAVRSKGVQVDSANGLVDTGLVYEYTPGDTSSHTFRIRVGANSGNSALNGQPGTAIFNGTSAAVLVVEEVKG